MAGQTQSLDGFKVKFEPEIWIEWAIPFANSLGGWLNEITKLSRTHGEGLGFTEIVS